MWQQLELASEHEFDLRDTIDWGRKWFVDYNAGKTQLILFDQSNNTGAIDVKIDGSVPEEKSSFKMLGLNWIGAFTLSLFLKLPPRKLKLDSFYEVSFSLGCSVCLLIYHMTMHRILLSCLGWCY